MDINVHHLLLFEAISRSETITAAAEKLMISQPAVSKQLRQLEKSLGTALVERGAKRIRLTEAGRAVAAIAKQIAQLKDQIPGTVADLRSLRTGRLRIGASPSLATYLLPDVLIRFARKFPGVRLHVETAGSVLLARRLADGEIDIALTESPIRSPAINCRTFAHDDMIPIVAPDHAFARRSATLRQFLAEAFIAHDAVSGQLSQVQQAIQSRQIDLHPAFSLPSTEAIKRAVAAGLGVAIVPRLSIAAELNSKSLASVTLKDFTLRRNLYHCTPAAASPTKAVIAFDCLLKHAVRGTLPAHRRSIAR